MQFTYRAMSPDDEASGLRLSKEENWNQTIKEWEFILNGSDTITLAATHEDKIVGTASAIQYTDHHAWIAMVLVDKSYRGEGISTHLLKLILEKPGRDKIIKLDATLTGQLVYQRLGFVPEYKIYRLRWERSDLSSSSTDLNTTNSNHNLKSLIVYDEKTGGVNRHNLISWYIDKFPDYVFSESFNEQISGMVMGRLGLHSFHIGSLIADDIGIAKRLFLYILNNITEASIILDIPAYQYEFLTWVQSMGFVKQREFMRMYRHDNIVGAQLEKQFLICGPEFG